MADPLETSPVAELDFVIDGNRRPGWYVYHQVNGNRVSERLPIELGADAFGAMSEAAELLGCRIDEIEFSGPIWPKPLDGHVDPADTMEYVTQPSSQLLDKVPDFTRDSGAWQLLAEPVPAQPSKRRADQRRSKRRRAEGVRLFGPVYGQVLNWSESGMGIEIGQPLEISSRELFLTKGERSQMKLYGEVRWCRKIHEELFGQPPSYHAGVSLIG